MTVIGILAIVGGVPVAGYGILSWFAGSMSSNPAAGIAMGKSGLVTAAVGLALIAFGIWSVR